MSLKHSITLIVIYCFLTIECANVNISCTRGDDECFKEVITELFKDCQDPNIELETSGADPKIVKEYKIEFPVLGSVGVFNQNGFTGFSKTFFSKLVYFQSDGDNYALLEINTARIDVNGDIHYYIHQPGQFQAPLESEYDIMIKNYTMNVIFKLDDDGKAEPDSSVEIYVFSGPTTLDLGTEIQGSIGRNQNAFKLTYNDGIKEIAYRAILKAICDIDDDDDDDDK